MTENMIVGTKVIQIPPSHKREVLVIANMSSDRTVYWGSTDQVTTSDGIPMFPETVHTFMKIFGDRPQEAKYLISTHEDIDVRVDETEVE